MIEECREEEVGRRGQEREEDMRRVGREREAESSREKGAKRGEER